MTPLRTLETTRTSSPVNQCLTLKGLTPYSLISTECRDEECVDLYLTPPPQGLLAWYLCVVMDDFCEICCFHSNFVEDLKVMEYEVVSLG